MSDSHFERFGLPVWLLIAFLPPIGILVGGIGLQWLSHHFGVAAAYPNRVAMFGSVVGALAGLFARARLFGVWFFTQQ